jgi:hypothetical protein
MAPPLAPHTQGRRGDGEEEDLATFAERYRQRFGDRNQA